MNDLPEVIPTPSREQAARFDTLMQIGYGRWLSKPY
jgi:hypothetical protein